MGLTFLTGYILGQHGAQSARVASEAARNVASSTNELLEVHDRVDRLILVIDAIWSLMEEHGYTDDDLRARIEEIDASDGAVDGKRRLPATPCRSCDSMVPAGQTKCQFCGDAVTTEPGNPIAGI